MVNGSVNALHIALAAAVVGWLVFSLSHSIAVWKKRSAAAVGRRSLGLLFAAALLCCIGLVGGWLNRELVRRAGAVAGTDFFVVRAHAGAAATLTEADSLRKGDELASYDAPEAAREIQRLRDEIVVLDAQMNTRMLMALEVNPQLLEKSQAEAEAQRGRLAQLGYGLVDGQGGASRPNGGDLLGAQRSKNEAAQLQLQRTVSLVDDGVLPREKLDAARAAAQAAAQELHERERLIAATKVGSATVARSEAAVLQDGTRARAERSSEVVELAARAAGLRNDLRHLESEQTVQAPFAGTVVYRHSSPALASPGEVVLALAKGVGFLATIQVPAREAGLIRSGQTLSMKLQHSLVSEQISGRLVSTRVSAGSPDRADLMIECSLPPEQFGTIASGPVPVTLEWRPGLWHDRFAQSGVSSAALLVLLWLLAQLRGHGGREPKVEEIDRVLAGLNDSLHHAGAAK